MKKYDIELPMKPNDSLLTVSKVVKEIGWQKKAEETLDEGGWTLVAKTPLTLASWGEDVIFKGSPAKFGTLIRVKISPNQLYDWGMPRKRFHEFIDRLRTEAPDLKLESVQR